MYTEQYVIGTKQADQFGLVAFTWTLPANTTTGSHRLVLVGNQSGSVETTFTVAATTGSLVSTGGSIPSQAALIGVILLVAGLTTAWFARRRQLFGRKH
jgi:hypothetical protein